MLDQSSVLSQEQRNSAQFSPELLQSLETKILARVQEEIENKIELVLGKRLKDVYDI